MSVTIVNLSSTESHVRYPALGFDIQAGSTPLVGCSAAEWDRLAAALDRDFCKVNLGPDHKIKVVASGDVALCTTMHGYRAIIKAPLAAFADVFKAAANMAEQWEIEYHQRCVTKLLVDQVHLRCDINACTMIRDQLGDLSTAVSIAKMYFKTPARVVVMNGLLRGIEYRNDESMLFMISALVGELTA